MKVRNFKKNAAWMILLSALAATVWGQAPKVRIKVVAENACIRIKPDAASDILASIPVGSVFEVENKSGEWYEIKHRAGLGILFTGYIQEKFVELEKAPEAKPSLPPAEAQTQATTRLKVKVPVASVRDAPNLSAAVVKQVTLGTELESRQKIGDMYEVMITDEKGMAISGYINGNLVDVIGPGRVISAPEAKPSLPPAEAPKPPVPVETQRSELQKAAAAEKTKPPSATGKIKKNIHFKAILGLCNSGSSSSQYYGSPVSSSSSIHPSGGVGLEFGRRLAFEVDILIVPKIYTLGYSWTSSLISRWELSLPLLAKYYLSADPQKTRLFLFGGIQIAQTISAVEKETWSFSGGSDTYTSTLSKKADGGFILGGGADIRLGGGPTLFIEGRLQLDLGKMDSGSYDPVTTHVIGLFAGIKF